MNTIKLKINNVPKHSGTITVQADENGLPVDKFWRNRLADAEIDGCVEVVKQKAKKRAVKHDHD